MGRNAVVGTVRRDAADALTLAQQIDKEARQLGLQRPAGAAADGSDGVSDFDRVVDDDELRGTCRALFLDGHYALAVEEAYKCVNNVVKNCAAKKDENLDGASLMRHVFSVKEPILALNGMASQSERDQQQGYMDIYAGVMTGVRNPRAHEHAYLDDPSTALELLGLANHLIRLARAATLVDRNAV